MRLRAWPQVLFFFGLRQKVSSATLKYGTVAIPDDFCINMNVQFPTEYAGAADYGYQGDLAVVGGEEGGCGGLMIVVSSRGRLHDKISSGDGLGMYVAVQCNGVAPHTQTDNIMSPGYGLGDLREFQFCMDSQRKKATLMTKGFKTEVDMTAFSFKRSGPISFMSGCHSNVCEELRGATLEEFDIVDLEEGARWAQDSGMVPKAPPPAPAPAPAPEPIVAVPLTVKVENVNYAQLISNGAADDFKKAVQTAVAKEAGDGITADDVLVELSPGSVVAKVTVKPKSGTVSSAAKTKLTGKLAVAKAVASGVSAVAGVKAASTGTISASTWSTLAECAPSVVTPAVITKFNTCGVSTGNFKASCGCFTSMQTVYEDLNTKCCPLEGGDREKDCFMAKTIATPYYRCLSKAGCGKFKTFFEKSFNELYAPFPAGTGKFATCLGKIRQPPSLQHIGDDTTCTALDRDLKEVQELKACCSEPGGPADCGERAEAFEFVATCARTAHTCKP